MENTKNVKIESINVKTESIFISESNDRLNQITDMISYIKKNSDSNDPMPVGIYSLKMEDKYNDIISQCDGLRASLMKYLKDKTPQGYKFIYNQEDPFIGYEERLPSFVLKNFAVEDYISSKDGEIYTGIIFPEIGDLFLEDQKSILVEVNEHKCNFSYFNLSFNNSNSVSLTKSELESLKNFLATRKGKTNTKFYFQI